MKTAEFALGLCILALLGLLAPRASFAAETYDLHVIIPLTGNGAFLGKGQQQVLDLLQGDVNRHGGIDGRPLRFLYHDDQTSPQIAVQLINEVVATHPAVILGSSLVAMCNAMAPIVRDGPLLFCLSPGHHPVIGTYDFTSGASSADSLRAMLRFFRDKGWTRIAMISSTDATGQDVDRSVAEVLALPENKTVEMVEHNHFNLTDLSVSAQIERIKSAKAQALIAWSSGTSIATIFKSAVQAGLDIPVGTTAGNYVYAQMQQFAAFLPQQLYIACALFPEHDGVFTLDRRVEAVQQNFYAVLQAGKIVPDNMAGTSWDAAYIVVDALRRLGAQATAAQVKATIAALSDYPGINGIYDFPKYPERGLGQDNTVVTRWSPARGRALWASQPGGEPLPK